MDNEKREKRLAWFLEHIYGDDEYETETLQATFRHGYNVGFDAGTASVDRKAIVEALNSAASFASQYDDGDNAATRLIAKLDAVLETIGEGNE